MSPKLRKWLRWFSWLYRLPAYLLFPVLLWYGAPYFSLALEILQELRKPLLTQQLPNGMLLTQNFDFTFAGRIDLLAADGQSRLAKDVSTLCFNDRYVDAPPHGLFDAETKSRVPDADYQAVYARSGLAGRPGCNGYYNVHIRSRLLMGGRKQHALPPCLVRNSHASSAANKLWQNFPCDHY